METEASSGPIQSPFKFLDPYGPEDREIFFGRDAEIAELYAKLFSAPVTVLYGESGTGKTSLIQCGLRNRIPLEDMLFVPVRTASEAEYSLRQALLKAMPRIEDGQRNLDELLRLVIRRSYKTVLLVFDQFEEFLLFQTEESQRDFIEGLANWLEEGLNLRVLIAIRQEYLAQLGALEKALPNLFDNRVWLRRMAREQAEAVIRGPCAKAGVEIASQLVQSLLDALSGLQGIDLPTLQVVLDRLYREAVAASQSQPVLSLEAYQALGQIHSILARFLDERIATLGAQAEHAKHLLKTLVTAEATRRPATREEIGLRLARDYRVEISENELAALLEKLVSERILREDPERHCYELRHDSLAPHVRTWMSVLEQELEALRESLRSRHREFQRNRRLLDAAFLADLAAYESRLTLAPELAEFVRQSKAELDALEQREREQQALRERKRRRVIAAVVFAFFVVVAAFGVFSFVQWQEAEHQKQQAEANFDKARQAVDEFFTEVSESRLLNEPKMEPLRKELLEKALKFYEELSRQRSEDPEMRYGLAHAAFNLARIKQDLGDHAGAGKAYARAIELFEKVAGEHPEAPQIRSDLALSYNNLGFLQQNSGYAAGARESYRKAIEIQEKLVREHPEVPQGQSNLALSHNNLGLLQMNSGDAAGARESYRKAIEIREILAREHSEVPQYQSELAQSLANLGSLQKNADDAFGARESYRKAIEIQEKIAREHPKVPQYQKDLATIHNNLGALQDIAGDAAGARESYRKAIEIREILAREHPDVPQYQNDLAQSHYNLGILQDDAGDAAGALKAYRKAIEIQEILAREHPEVPQYQKDLAGSHNNLGNLQQNSGDAASAGNSYRKAIEIQEKLAREQFEVPQYQKDLAGSHNNLGVLQDNADDAAGARESYRKAIEIREILAREHPEVPQYQSDLASSHNNLGSLQYSAGDAAGAREAFRKAIEIQERLVRDHHGVPEYSNNLARSYYNLGYQQRGVGNAAGARQSFQKAIDIWERLSSDHPDFPEYAKNLGLARSNLASSLGDRSFDQLLDRKPREALATATRALELDPTQTWIKTNLAHALLFDGQYDQALRIYTENRGLKIPENKNKTFAEVVLDDFKQLRAKGITHPNMKKIEKLLRSTK